MFQQSIEEESDIFPSDSLNPSLLFHLRPVYFYRFNSYSLTPIFEKFYDWKNMKNDLLTDILITDLHGEI